MRTAILIAILGLSLAFTVAVQKPIPSPQKEELVTALSRSFPEINKENIESELLQYKLVKGKQVASKKFIVFNKKTYQGFKTQTLKKVPYWKLKNHPSIDILYMYGTGWTGPVWGYLILDQTDKTVVDVRFFHKGETRTYGGDISLDWFQEQFIGMQLVDDGTLKKFEMPDREKFSYGDVQLDAISGATTTNIGVKTMFNGLLKNYAALLIDVAK